MSTTWPGARWWYGQIRIHASRYFETMVETESRGPGDVQGPIGTLHAGADPLTGYFILARV